MSTAARFVFPQSFPFCPADISGSVSAPYVDNLSLSDAMAFFWNFETFGFDTSGSNTRNGTTLDATMDFDLSPIGSTVFDEARMAASCAWYGSSFGFTSFGSFPDIRDPIARVCQSGANGRLLGIESDLTTGGANMNWSFWLGTDPSNAGKHRIYCTFLISRSATSPEVLEVSWSENNSVPANYSALNNGTFTISGLTFPYYSIARSDGGATATGGTMTVGRIGSFTY